MDSIHRTPSIPPADAEFDAPIQPLERAVLTLLGEVDRFAGCALAFSSVGDCLAAAAKVSALDRLLTWSLRVKDCAAQLHASGKAIFSFPSQSPDEDSVGHSMSRSLRTTLEPEETELARAALGFQMAAALSRREPLAKRDLQDHSTLLGAGQSRARSHSDWQKLRGKNLVEHSVLADLLADLSSTRVREYVERILAAIDTDIGPPPLPEPPRPTETTPGLLPSASDSSSRMGLKEGARRPPANQDEEELLLDGSTASTDPGSPVADVPPRKVSFEGWRALDALHAPHTRHHGLTIDWACTPLKDLARLCRSLKAVFPGARPLVQAYVCMAYHSMQVSLPPDLVLSIPLKDEAGLWYDVVEGAYKIHYRRLLDTRPRSGRDGTGTAGEVADTPPPYRVLIDADIAEHHRRALVVHPEALSLGDLMNHGSNALDRVEFIEGYREHLRSHGDPVHRSYAGRHRRSLGPAIKEITGSGIYALLLALDSSFCAPGLPHYVTVDQASIDDVQCKVLSALGWAPPSTIPSAMNQTVGARKALSSDVYSAGHQSLQAEAREWMAALSDARDAHQLVSSWNSLTHARLLTFGCLTGHRLTRIGRITSTAIYGCSDYICISDKVNSPYGAYRLIPASDRLQELRVALQEDRRRLQEALARMLPREDTRLACRLSRSGSLFFTLVLETRHGKLALRRTSVNQEPLDRLSQRHFGREANIGRHQLVSALIAEHMDEWHVSALTSHEWNQAEVHGDACSVPPISTLDSLRRGLNRILDSRLAPALELDSAAPRWQLAHPSCLPHPRNDPYLVRGNDKDHLLPPLADRHTTHALTVVGQVRTGLLSPPSREAPWARTLMCLAIFDGIHIDDLEVVVNAWSDSLVRLGECLCVHWQRSERRNFITVPLSPATLASLPAMTQAARPAWDLIQAQAADWLAQHCPDVPWPSDKKDAFRVFMAMVARHLRLHLSPVVYAASLPWVMSATPSTQSLLWLADPAPQGLPEEALSTVRALKTPSTRLRSTRDRPDLRRIGTLLSRYSDSHARLGEDRTRARLLRSALPTGAEGTPPSPRGKLERNDASDLRSALDALDGSPDLPALAARAVLHKELWLIQQAHPDALAISTLATYWTEVSISLALVAPSEDIPQWAEVDFVEWMDLTVQALDQDAARKGKSGGPELHGPRRFLKTGASLGWEVPDNLLGHEDIFAPNGMRQSAAAAMVSTAQFRSARTLVRHALQEHSLLWQRADLLLDLLYEIPARSGEIDTLKARPATRLSGMLCIRPAGFSVLKNRLATRLVPVSDALAAKLNDASEWPDAFGTFLFLEADGDDRKVLDHIRCLILQALIQVSGDSGLRFHSMRSGAACRLAYPSWEDQATALLAGTTGTRFGERPIQVTRDAMARAMASLGHARITTTITYYFPIWPLIRAHELRMSLEDSGVPVAYEQALLGTTQARRAAKSRAERSGKVFNHWDWIGRQMAARVEARPLQSDQPDVVLAPKAMSMATANADKMSLSLYGLLVLAGVARAAAAHQVGILASQASEMDRAVDALAPASEALWARRGGTRDTASAAHDRTLTQSDFGTNICKHLCTLPTGTVSLLRTCLDTDRRQLLLLPADSDMQNSRIEIMAKAMPPTVKLLVRPPASGSFRIDPALVLDHASSLVMGSPDRDAGRHCLFQVAPADDPSNRRRIGPLTGLVRAACVATLAAHRVHTGDHEQ